MAYNVIFTIKTNHKNKNTTIYERAVSMPTTYVNMNLTFEWMTALRDFSVHSPVTAYLLIMDDRGRVMVNDIFAPPME